MVLRFLFVILFLIFACADFERDNVYDTERSNPTYGLCGSDSQRFLLETQVCKNNVIETVCGSSSYNAANANLGCKSGVVVTRCGSDWYNAANASLRCESDIVETVCGSSWYNATNANLRCESNVVETVCGGGWFSAETHFCYNGKVEEKCGERSEIFDTDLYECRDTNKIYLKDSVLHGGKNYEAVVIGTHTWLAENLNYEVEGSNCYEKLDSNCVIHGRLYNWAEAMDTDVCPKGWHLPSYDELGALSKNKEIDVYGFAAKTSGFGFPGGILFDGIGEYGGWWSASVTQEDTSSVYYLHYDGSNVFLGISNKNVLLSVRCVKD